MSRPPQKHVLKPQAIGKAAATQPQAKLAALFSQGLALHQQGQLAQAKQIYAQVLALQPIHFDALHLSGVIAAQSKNPKLAVELIGKAIAINPNNAVYYSNRGNALKELGCYEEAVTSYDRAINMKPDYADAYFNRGIALQELKRSIDAVASYDRAIEIKPNYADAYYNRGIILKELKRYDDAIVSYDHAIKVKLDSENPKFYYNKALLLLQLQQFSLGLDLYQRRWEIKTQFSEKLDTKIPYWNRQNTNNQSKILLWAEQGIGDEIFYFGMLKNFSHTDAKVTVSADTRLHALFKRSMPELEFVDRKEIDNICDENAFDFQAPIGDIGQLFSVDRSLEHKTPKSFFQINQSRCSEIKNKNHFLSDKFVCGISWKSTNKDIGITKSLNLIDLSPLLSIENVVFVSLQYGSTADEIEFVEKNIGIKIHTIDSLDIFNDIDGLVSLISLCDLVVTTSNITAHLTGAIGKKGMVLMPFSKGKIWYWHSGVGPSLWYPSLELVSQSQMNDWTDPINKCKEWVLGQL